MSLNNKIILRDGRELIGVSNIVVSELENSIFITSNTATLESIDISTTTLTANNIVSDDITIDGHSILELIKSTNIISENTQTSALNADLIIAKSQALLKRSTIQDWLGFDSKIKDNTQPFKISVAINPATNKEALIFKSCVYDDENISSHLPFALEDNRAYLTKPNIPPNTIASPVGTEDDIKGDIAIDENYLYYCTADYNGTSSIWKRFALTDW